MAIYFLSDFGTSDAYAGVVENVIAQIAPNVRIFHLTHGIAPQDVRNASWQLWAACPYLPDNAIVLAVVDPGVGSERRPIVVSGRLMYVAPDNGLLAPALLRDAPRSAHVLEDARYRRPEVSASFHGRDIFGPAAAHLALGVEPSSFGPELALDELARPTIAPADERGEIWTFDRFGNAITTICAPQHASAIEVRGRSIPFHTHYAAVATGHALALTGSSGLVEISVREGSARAELELHEGYPVRLVP